MVQATKIFCTSRAMSQHRQSKRHCLCHCLLDCLWSRTQPQFYFEGNGVDDEYKQRAILLSVCGGKTYKLIWNLTTPGKPSEKTFAELVELVQQHQHPKHWAIVKWFKFNTRFRKPGESIASYVAELRSLSEQCDFKRCYRWSVDVWNKWRTDSAQIVSRKFSRLYESHKNSYINGDCSKERTRFYISAM
jgi:hypothetical protein